MSLYSDVLKLIRRHKLLEGARTVIVGLSGGPDSVCLLDLLAWMAERGDLGAKLHAAHLNHGLRGAESDEDERFARDFAESRNVPITIEKKDVAAARAGKGGSLEEVARRERYGFLALVANDVGAEAVAVGHNADDQVETVLHRLIRGTGLKGLRGIPLARLIGDGSAVRLVRPLLRTRRSDILDHLQERGLSFREDSSNRDVGFTRNRIRHELLPLIESGYNPAFGESLLRLSRAAADAYELLLEVAHTGATDCLSGSVIDISQFGLVHGAARPLVIDAAVAAAADDPPQFDAVHYDAIIELALDGEPGSRLDLPGGIAATRSRSAVEFARTQQREPVPRVEVPLQVPGETFAAGVAVTTTLVDRSGLDLDAFLGAKTRYDEVLDFDAVVRPFVLRSRRAGDKFRPLGAAGRKKVGDFLTDSRVPADERDRVLIVADGEGPVWVVGHRIADRAKVTPETKRVMKLSVQKGREADGEEGP